jgi:uncharacterized oligopeptide transporter (OPT) family protein
MSHDPAAPPGLPAASPKPAGLRELSPRAIACGLVVAAVMGASYPYIVLKVGFWPNVAVVAAYLVPFASGLIASEALVTVVVPLLVVTGVLEA